MPNIGYGWKYARIQTREGKMYKRKLYFDNDKAYIQHDGQRRELFSDSRRTNWYAYGGIKIISFIR